MEMPKNLQTLTSCNWLGTGKGEHDPYWRIYGRDADEYGRPGPWSPGTLGNPYRTRAEAVMAAEQRCQHGYYHADGACNATANSPR